MFHPEGIQTHYDLYSLTISTGAGKSRAGPEEGRSEAGREKKPEVRCKWAEESLDCDHAEEGELRGSLPLCGQVLTELSFIRVPVTSAFSFVSFWGKVVLSSAKYLFREKTVNFKKAK